MTRKIHPDDVVCPTCSGVGYESAARKMCMEDMPMMHKPIGLWPCTGCNGTGLLIDGAAMEKVLESLKDHIK